MMRFMTFILLCVHFFEFGDVLFGRDATIVEQIVPVSNKIVKRDTDMVAILGFHAALDHAYATFEDADDAVVRFPVAVGEITSHIYDRFIKSP